MSEKNLYNELLEAYSHENLNRITRKLVELYKEKKFGAIREIAHKIAKHVFIGEENDSKCFSRLIMLYHPDRGEQFRRSIQALYKKGDIDNLKWFSHIFLISDMDFSRENGADDVEFTPEYFWDAEQEDGFSFNRVEENEESDFDKIKEERTFYNAIKLREYGRLDIEFPPYYLEDFEEFELSSCGLESLDGVEYCKHVKVLDLSNNEITDISDLSSLQGLEEVYLSDNRIGYIDALSGLTNLNLLDISNNEIDDLSPILDLEKLEFVNLMGNPVNTSQVKELQDKGVVVIEG